MKLQKVKNAGIGRLEVDRDEHGSELTHSFSVTYRHGDAGPDIFWGHIRTRMEARRQEIVKQFNDRIAAGEVVVSELTTVAKPQEAHGI